MNIVIVIPTKNEVDNLKKLNSSIKKSLKNVSYKLCFVDGSNTLSTIKAIKKVFKKKVHIIREKKRPPLAPHHAGDAAPSPPLLFLASRAARENSTSAVMSNSQSTSSTSNAMTSGSSPAKFFEVVVVPTLSRESATSPS